MNSRREEGSLDLIADALVQWAGSGTLIIDHMVRWGKGEPEQSSAPDPFDSFKNVVRSALGTLEERHAAVDLATAAAVMADAVETAAGEILLVEPTPPQLDRDGHGS
jgi:hypothetical protein